MIRLLQSWFGARIAVILLAVVVFLVALVLTFLLHRLYFVILPQWAVKRFKRPDPERLRRYLELVAATPSLAGPVEKLFVRGALVGIYLPQGRHAEAAAHCRANLASLEWARGRHKLDFAALEADARRRLADCLDGLGQTQEAEEERRLAEACVERAPGDAVRHLTQGTLLERQHRYAEACTAFEQALSYTSESDRQVRIECMSHLVIACFNAGRPVECLRWAEQVIALGADGIHLRAPTGWRAWPAETWVVSTNRRSIAVGLTMSLSPLEMRAWWARFSAASRASSASEGSSQRPTRRARKLLPWIPKPCEWPLRNSHKS